MFIRKLHFQHPTGGGLVYSVVLSQGTDGSVSGMAMEEGLNLRPSDPRLEAAEVPFFVLDSVRPYVFGPQAFTDAALLLGAWYNETSPTGTPRTLLQILPATPSVNPGAPPAAVTGLAETLATPNTITWAWVAPPTAAFYIVRVRTAPSGPWGPGVVVNTPTYTAAGLTPSTAYEIEVVAANGIGSSPAVTDPATTAPPSSNPANTPTWSFNVATNALTFSSNAPLFYTVTTNGSEPPNPTSSSTPYTGPITAVEGQRFKVIATGGGFTDSAILEVEVVSFTGSWTPA